MLSYYLSVMRELPRLFRRTYETISFWTIPVLAIVTIVTPDVHGLMRDNELPRWVGGIIALFAVGFALLRANYRRVRQLEVELELHSEAQTEKYTALCELQKEVNSLVRRPYGTADQAREFSQAVRTFWSHVESSLFPFLQPNEQGHLAYIAHPESLGFGNTTDHDLPILHALRNQINAWADTSKPQGLPPARRNNVTTTSSE